MDISWIRGGSHVDCVLAFHSNDPSSNPAEPTVFYYLP